MPRPKQDDTLQFRLSITCENEAFGSEPELEIVRILRDLADRIEHGFDLDTCVDLRDYNGNTVGQTSLKTVHEHDNGRRSNWRAARGLVLALLCCLPLLSACAPRACVHPADLVTVAQYPDGTFSVDLYGPDGQLDSTVHLAADARLSDIFTH